MKKVKRWSFLMLTGLFLFLAPMVFGLTLESSQYRIETGPKQSDAVGNGFKPFPTFTEQGYSLTESNQDVGFLPPEKTSLALSPSLAELVIKPGKSAQVRYEIKNAGDPELVTVKIRSLVGRQKPPGFAIKEQLPSSPVLTLTNEKGLKEKAFFLASKNKARFIMTITVPAKTELTDVYYGLTLEHELSGRNTLGQSRKKKSTLAGVLLISVTETGRLETALAIESMKIDNKTIQVIDVFDQPRVKITINNEGQRLIHIGGQISVSKPFGGANLFALAPMVALANSRVSSTTGLISLPWGRRKITARINTKPTAGASGKEKLFTTGLTVYVVPAKAIGLLILLIGAIFFIGARGKAQKRSASPPRQDQ